VYEKQVKLSIMATLIGPQNPEVQGYQKQITHSLNFRFIAVKRVTFNFRVKTAGIKSIADQENLKKLRMIKKLGTLFYDKLLPARRNFSFKHQRKK
jgi:hypothetical protein